MKKTQKARKLQLNKQTVRNLGDKELRVVVAGGNTDSNCSFCDHECTAKVR